MFIEAIKQKIQQQKQEELRRIQEITENAHRFEQSVLEAMESVEEDSEKPILDNSSS